MQAVMPKPKENVEDLAPTRYSLIARLKESDDHQGWNEFFDLYWKLIYHVALKSGLSETESQEVVQETLITVSKNIHKFEADPSKGSFKAWLLKTTRWRIINQFKKRRPDQLARHHRAEGDDRNTATLDRIPDEKAAEMEAMWDGEWRDHQISLAMERLKGKLKPKHYQVFHLLVAREKTVSETARLLDISQAQVYLIKHRVVKLFKEEVRRIEAHMNEPDQGKILNRGS